VSFIDPNYELVVEVALIIFGRQDDLLEKEGDIVVARRQLGGCGLKEGSRFLWMQLAGLEENDLLALNINLDTNNYEISEERDPDLAFDKHRYKIPFDSIVAQFSTVDLNRVRDPNDIYQPFMEVDIESFWFLDNQQIANAGDLVIDKLTELPIE